MRISNEKSVVKNQDIDPQPMNPLEAYQNTQNSTLMSAQEIKPRAESTIKVSCKARGFTTQNSNKQMSQTEVRQAIKNIWSSDDTPQIMSPTNSSLQKSLVLAEIIKDGTSYIISSKKSAEVLEMHRQSPSGSQLVGSGSPKRIFSML